jgi:hypothetical protein
MRKLLLCFVLLILTLASAQAQPDGSPLILSMEGDFYQWDEATNTLTQLTTWGYNERAVLSPDGTRFAYNSWAQVTVDGIAAGTDFMSQPPSNIWVWDIATGNATRIVDQPENATYGEYSFENAVLRSTPTWSPDGAKIAWTEMGSSFELSGGFRLVVYDFTTDSATTLRNDLPLGYQDAGLYLPPVIWTQAGIVLRETSFSETGQPFGFSRLTHIYDENGDKIALIESGTQGYDQAVVPYEDGLAVTFRYPRWEILYPQTGGPIEGTLALTSKTASDGLAFIPYEDYHWGEVKGSIELPRLAVEELALSPDGEAAAYTTDAGVEVAYRDGTTVLIPDTQHERITLVWGVTEWRRLNHSTAPVETLTGSCAGSDLEVSGQAQVSPSLEVPLNLYLLVNPLRYVVERIPAGTTLTLNEAVCVDGATWWQVAYNGSNGWVMEGLSETPTKWLLPVD